MEHSGPEDRISASLEQVNLQELLVELLPEVQEQGFSVPEAEQISADHSGRGLSSASERNCKQADRSGRILRTAEHLSPVALASEEQHSAAEPELVLPVQELPAAVPAEPEQDVPEAVPELPAAEPAEPEQDVPEAVPELPAVVQAEPEPVLPVPVQQLMPEQKFAVLSRLRKLVYYIYTYSYHLQRPQR